MNKRVDWQDEEHTKLVLKWAIEASATLPQPSNWGLFVAGMKKSAAEKSATEDTDSSRRQQIGVMVATLFDLLNREPAFADPVIRSGLMPLIMALHDIGHNVQPALFTSNRTRTDGAPFGAAKGKTKGAAARALLELLDCGVDLDIAADRVARAVRAGRCSGYEKCDATKIKSWQRDLRLGVGINGKRTVALDTYEWPLPEEAGVAAETRAEFILRSLRFGKLYR